jgi:ABC-type enterochelin transport system ATPase subunit
LLFEEPNQSYFKQILPVEEQRSKTDWYIIICQGTEYITLDLPWKAFSFKKLLLQFLRNYVSISATKF